MAAAPFRLLLITDLGVADEAKTCRRIVEIAGAIDPSHLMIGLRDHAACVGQRYDFGRKIRSISSAIGACSIVFDRVDLALALRADGVHLGRRSVSVGAARGLLAEGALIGRSCHDAHELEAAARDGADYATLGPIFDSPGKGASLGVDAFAHLRARVPALRVFALGGIDAASLSKALVASSDGVAMIRGAFGEDAAGALVAALRSLDAR